MNGVNNRRKKQNHNKQKEKIWLKITYPVLERLFGVARKTIQVWIADSRLDPTDILDIIDKYQHRDKLDRRKKRSATQSP